ncbi:MAG: hypothetical protein QOH67_185, partial [Hyphomicrobiales bacterium]|nr:hypothetical protein [Hyphomicrobiales bacterium]
TRTWSKEGMALFGFALPDGRGQVGGDADEFGASLHPDDRHLLQRFHELADKQDSFAAEYRIVRPGGEILWLSGRGQVVSRTPDGRAHRMVNIVADITERKQTEDHVQFLMREISHRSKNLMAVIQSIARRTARSSGTIEEFDTRFQPRLHSLAALHDVLFNEGWRGAPLADLVRQQLVPFIELQSERIDIAGPAILVTAGAAQAISLAIHELATNATKYGAWSVAAGKVAVTWRFVSGTGGARPLLLSWVERGGPRVAPPARKGFGHLVIDDMIARALDGKVEMEFAEQGLNWTVSIPEPNLVRAAGDS